MDSFFGIGTPELLVILILAGIVMGPQRIAQFARWLGKTTATLQTISRGFAMQLKQELESIDEGGEMKDMLAEMRSLQKEVSNLRQQVNETAAAAVAETKKSVEESKDIVNQSIQPPNLGEEPAAEPAKPPVNGAAPEPQPQPIEIPSLIEVPDDPE